MKPMKSMGTLETRLAPLAERVGSNWFLTALRDSFAAIMPLLIIGSMFTLVANFPIPAWTDFLAATTVGPYTLKALISIPASCSVSMMALFIAFTVGYSCADHLGVTDRLSAGIVSLTSWLILMPLFTTYTPEDATEAFEVPSIPLDWVGARGVFVALVAGFLTVRLFAWVIERNWTIKMPAGVPPTVSRAFSALIPMAVTFVAVWVVRALFVFTPWDDAFTFIYTFLQIPLQQLGGTVWAQALVYLFAHMLWFFGIHGTNITDSVYRPILTSLSVENQQAVAAGIALPNVINAQFQDLFATYGGAGSTLSLIIAALLVCRSERVKKLSRLSLAPAIFEINEPVIFGLPIVMNPVLFIPFLLVPTINILTTYVVMAAGIVPICNGVLLPWTTPPIISGFLVSGWQGAVWQTILIALGTLIYLPFMRVLDRQYLEEEAKATPEGAASDLDAVNLDEVTL